MNRYRLIYLFVLISLLFSACGAPAPAPVQTLPPTPAPTPLLSTLTPLPPTPAPETPEEIVKGLVAAKLAALNAKDLDRFMALLWDADPEYLTEQRNWFLIYRDVITADFSINVLGVEKIDENTLVASLYQRYLYGPEKIERRVTYEQKYLKTASGWKDADLNFKIKETEHFVVKYPAQVEAKAVVIAGEAEKAYTGVIRELQIVPQGKVTIKVFADQEMLRQNTDIRVAFLFSGWAEDGEALKMYSERDQASLTRVIAHELTHKVTLAVSDSQPSWLAEGLAGYFGTRVFRGGSVLELGLYTPADLAKPVSWLEETNLIDQTDGNIIGVYYAASALVVEFIVKSYGLGTLKAILNELATYPRYDRGLDYTEMEVENQKRLHQSIEKVLGINPETFNRRWLEWLRAQG